MPDADEAIAATLTWTLPTLDVKGNTLTEIQSVTVLRDGKSVVTLDGAATSWTDTDETADTEGTKLTQGSHTYAIQVQANGFTGERSEEVTIFVGPWQYKPKDFDGWTSYSSTKNSWSTFNSFPSSSTQEKSMRIWSNVLIENIDSWLISPELPLEAGQSYKLTFQYLTYYDDATIIEHIRGHLCAAPPTADNAADIAESDAFLALDNLIKGIDSNDWKAVSIIVTPQEGDKHVTFHVYGQYCKHILISNFSISKYIEKPFKPEAPANLKATAGENHALTVKLTWDNPTHDTAGDPFTADKTIDGTVIYRDSEYVTTVEGNATSWTDTEETGLTAGGHTYAVSSVVAGVESALSEEADVSNVGPLLPVDADNWESGFDKGEEEFNNMWTSKSDNGYYSPAWTYRENQNCIVLINNNGYAEDAWIISRPLTFKPGQYYTLEIEGYATSAEHLLTPALVSDASNPNADQYIIGQNDPEANHKMSLEYERSTHGFEFYFDPQGKYTPLQRSPDENIPYHIAIHAGNTGISALTFIYSIGIKEVEGKTTSINSINADTTVTRVEVYDLAGRHIGSASSTGLEEFDAGLYIVRIVKADGSYITSKILK